MEYTLPTLPYAYGDLEPYLDTPTMEIHHTRHHQGYVNNLNKALVDHPALQQKSLDELLKTINTLPEGVRVAVRNHGGGHANHSLFWTVMKKNGGGEPAGPVGVELKKLFGPFAAFKDQFNGTAKSVFGSGWAWLSVDPTGKLVITSTVNQDSPLLDGLRPILGLDVWEHAYYLKYQNKRPDYINAWWHVIDWQEVERRYHEIIG